jgi:nicotinamidase-related amidase
MKNILIVVDMQKGFIRDNQKKELTERIIELLDKKIFDAVIATKFLNAENSIYEKIFNWERLESEEEQEIPSRIIEHVDYVVDKYIYNCVNASFIQRICQINDGKYPEKVFVVGVDTDCCVLTIATSLFENNIRPIVLTHYVDSNGGTQSHEAGLLCMKRLIGEKQLSDVMPNSKTDLDNI